MSRMDWLERTYWLEKNVDKNADGWILRYYYLMLAESREQALDRMQGEAEKLGANAIVGMRFITASIMGGAAELLAYGTAVIVE